MKTQVKIQKQQGMTLMEVLAALAIVATVVVGSLSLFGAANSSSISSQMSKDLIALRTATQAQFTGQGSFGTAGSSLNEILIKSNKVPTSMSANTTTNAITTSFNGAVTLTVNSTNVNQFDLAVTNVAPEICASLLTGMSSGWGSVQVGAGTPITQFPVSPTVATGANGCQTGANTITWTTG